MEQDSLWNAFAHSGRVEDYLTQQFGDFMQLPPEEQRVSVHPGFVDLETPFAEYKEGRKSFR